jgi:hypothetical protein
MQRRLVPGSPFVFREPFGLAWEVKVALSGFFGRYVARACLEIHGPILLTHRAIHSR